MVDEQYFSTALKIQVILFWCCVFHELPKTGKGCGVLGYVYYMWQWGAQFTLCTPHIQIKFLSKPAILSFEKNKYDIFNPPSLIPFAVKKGTLLELQQVSHLDPRRDGANAKFSTNWDDTDYSAKIFRNANIASKCIAIFIVI
jgi:hypothetical protein